MKVYLAGPMSGIPAFNIPAFDKAASLLRELGHHVISPAEVDGETSRAVLLQSEHGSHDDLPPSDGGWSAYLARDFRIIIDEHIEAIVCLPGWTASKGANWEVWIGEKLGIPRLDFDPRSPTLGLSTSATLPVCSDGSCDDPDHADDLYEAGRFVPFVENPLRQRQVSGGVKDNKGKSRVDLIPSKPLVGVGMVLAAGASKYKPNNWRLGLRWSDTLGSILRHLLAFSDGEDIDPETNLPHIDQALCQNLFLSEYYHTKTGIDDRWSSLSEEEKGQAKA